MHQLIEADNATQTITNNETNPIPPAPTQETNIVTALVPVEPKPTELPKESKSGYSIAETSTELEIISDVICDKNIFYELYFIKTATDTQPNLVLVFYRLSGKKQTRTLISNFKMPLSVEAWEIEKTKLCVKSNHYHVIIPKRTQKGKVR